MAAWLAWAIAALLLAVGEIFTPGLFFLGPIAVGAVVAAFVSLAGMIFVFGAIALRGLNRVGVRD